MPKKNLWLITLVIALAAGVMTVGCDGSTPDDEDNDLPAANGANAVGGKTYYETSRENIIFSATADGAANGTYTGRDVESGLYGPNDKFRYIDIETGIYIWNEEAKTVTLKPVNIAPSFGGGIGSSGNSGNSGGGYSVEIENNYGPLGNKTAYRKSLQAELDSWREEEGDAAVNQELSSEGFSSVAAYLDFAVSSAFADRTYEYSFSTDGTSLFLGRLLPANNGTNELSGQTYNGVTWNSGDNPVKDNNKVYVFTVSGYTYTRNYGSGSTEIEEGSYAYDSISKLVWLKPEIRNGNTRSEYYDAQTVTPGHKLVDDNAARTASTNSAFDSIGLYYDSTKKIMED